MDQDETDQDVLAQEDSKVRIQGGGSAARPRLRGLPMSKPSPLQTVTHIAAWKPLSQVQHRVQPQAAVGVIVYVALPLLGSVRSRGPFLLASFKFEKIE
jgi:hypothetical protein